MAREQVAGAIILDRLRERMVSGRFLGHWRPGDRLPSIREIAEAESVDRKTAAAAYRRLEEEGLVRVRARSGVYLSPPGGAQPVGPLERLYRRWLENTYDGAAALGLDTRSILRLVTAMAEVERMRLPVVECDWPQAEAVAVELRERLGVRATPCVLEELHPSDPLLLEAPLLVTTPYHAAELALLSPNRLIVETTLAPDLVRQLARRAAQGPVTILAPHGNVVAKIRRALLHCGIEADDSRVRIFGVADRSDVAEATRFARSLFLWPGTPRWVEEALPPSAEPFRPKQAVSQESVTRLRAALLDAAILRAKDVPVSDEVAPAPPPLSTSIADAVRR
ncbi:MAG TPA: GntR family transcriptional regulator [Longimicrobiales bacterium]|nr:GntR family transcriptional regulator [Longimicrobiales bacterium]